MFCLFFCFSRQTKQIRLYVFWENLYANCLWFYLTFTYIPLIYFVFHLFQWLKCYRQFSKNGWTSVRRDRRRRRRRHRLGACFFDLKTWSFFEGGWNAAAAAVKSFLGRTYGKLFLHQSAAPPWPHIPSKEKKKRRKKKEKTCSILKKEVSSSLSWASSPNSSRLSSAWLSYAIYILGSVN